MSNARELAELGGSYGTGGFVGMKNRIINGGMEIHQRGGTISASGTVNTYGVDRFAIRSTSGSVVTSMQQSTVAPTGFYSSLLCTVTTADASLAADDLTCLFQRIEGVNVSDLGWGAAGAKSVTLSFWVRSNLTGTYGFGVQNNDGNRSYPSTYTISAANTWEYKTITIPGDTTGTWNLGTTSTALYVFFGLSAGSNYTGGTNNAWNASDCRGASGQVNWGATLSNNFYITGVQLEKGSTATSFDFRDYGREFYMCQRYFQSLAYAASQLMSTGISYSTTAAAAGIYFPQEMRATPSITLPAAGQSTGQISFLNGSSYPAATGSHAILNANSRGFRIEGTGYTGLGGVGTTAWLYPSGNVNILASAEL